MQDARLLKQRRKMRQDVSSAIQKWINRDVADIVSLFTIGDPPAPIDLSTEYAAMAQFGGTLVAFRFTGYRVWFTLYDIATGIMSQNEQFFCDSMYGTGMTCVPNRDETDICVVYGDRLLTDVCGGAPWMAMERKFKNCNGHISSYVYGELVRGSQSESGEWMRYACTDMGDLSHDHLHHTISDADRVFCVFKAHNDYFEDNQVYMVDRELAFSFIKGFTTSDSGCYKVAMFMIYTADGYQKVSIPIPKQFALDADKVSCAYDRKAQLFHVVFINTNIADGRIMTFTIRPETILTTHDDECDDGLTIMVDKSVISLAYSRAFEIEAASIDRVEAFCHDDFLLIAINFQHLIYISSKPR